MNKIFENKIDLLNYDYNNSRIKNKVFFKILASSLTIIVGTSHLSKANTELNKSVSVKPKINKFLEERISNEITKSPPANNKFVLQALTHISCMGLGFFAHKVLESISKPKSEPHPNPVEYILAEDVIRIGEGVPKLYTYNFKSNFLIKMFTLADHVYKLIRTGSQHTGAGELRNFIGFKNKIICSITEKPLSPQVLEFLIADIRFGKIYIVGEENRTTYGGTFLYCVRCIHNEILDNPTYEMANQLAKAALAFLDVVDRQSEGEEYIEVDPEEFRVTFSNLCDALLEVAEHGDYRILTATRQDESEDEQ